jgi:hypothetical protein
VSATNPAQPSGDGASGAAPTTEQPTVSVPLGPPTGEAAAPPLAIPGLPLDRPELHVGAAFVGGLLLATLLKRFAR